jgi:hypothetical protein
MSDISQLASRVGGGGVGQSLSIPLHYLAQGERQGGADPCLSLGGLRSLPLPSTAIVVHHDV